MRKLLPLALSAPFLLACALSACSSDPIDAESPAAPECAEPTPDDCDGRCVDLDRDPLACGACGETCPDGSVCVQGGCEAECSGLYPDRCDDTCVDLRNDPDHCGECGHRCDPGDFCSAGRCTSECGAYAPDECRGHCVDTRSDPRFCGGCDTACGPGQLCAGGECVSDCVGARPDECSGRCVDTSTDPLFCGDCATACPVGQVCSDGKCQNGCSEPFGQFCDGLCVDADHDVRACGRCGVFCKPDAVCSSGTCAAECLSDGEARCGDACVALATDPRHCGSCDNACAEGLVCSDGVCSEACGGDTPIRCGSRCVAEDEAAACGLECRDATPSSCGDRCVDLESDPAHCGACDNPCELGEQCVDSTCEPICPGRVPDVCEGSCVDKRSDEQHCGSCGNACDEGYQCQDGKCLLECEDPGAVACADACVDTNSDPAHCGACGRACDDGQRCDAGSCVSHVTRIASSMAHVCGLLVNGEVTCLGGNTWGQLGNAALPDDGSQVSRVQGLTDAVELAAGSEHTCALLSGGAVECWGADYYGQTGGDLSVDKNEEPFEVGGLSAGRAIAAGQHHTCILTESDEVQCWGWNMFGQLGRADSTADTYEPGTVDDTPGDLSVLACGGQHCCVRREHPNADVYCWGSAGDGQLGNGSSPTPQLPALVADLPALDPSRSEERSITASSMHSCATAGTGQVYCWGNNFYGQLGVAEATSNVVQVLGLPQPARAVYSGTGRSCALLDDESLWCWGIEFDGSGNGPTPELVVASSAGVVDVSTQYDNAYVFTAAGEILSFGGAKDLLGRLPHPAYTPTPCCTTF